MHDHMKVIMWVCACAILHNLFIEDFCDIGWNDVFDFNLDEENIEHIPFKRLSRAWESKAKLKREYIKNVMLHYHFFIIP